MHPVDPNETPATPPSGEDDSLQREIAYLETWLEYRPAVAPIVLNRLGELGRELRADLPRLMAERRVKTNVAKLRAERAKRDRMRDTASIAAMIAIAPSIVVAAPAAAVAETGEFQVAAGQEAATASLVLRVMDAVTGKPLQGVKLMTVAQEIIAVTDASGQAPVPAKFAAEGILSLERDGYPIVLIQGAKLAGRSLVTMKPFTDEKLAAKKKPATTARKAGGPIVKLPTPPSSSAVDEAMAALNRAPNPLDQLAAAPKPAEPLLTAAAPVEPPHGPEAPVVAAEPIKPAPLPVEPPVVAAAPVDVAPPAPVHQAAPDGDYGPIAEAPVAPTTVAAAPAGVPAQIAPAPAKPKPAPVVAIKKPTAKAKPAAKPVVAAKPVAPKVAQAKPAAHPAPHAQPAAHPVQPVIAAAPVAPEKPVARPLLPIAPPIVSVAEVEKLATAVPVDDPYGPSVEAPVVAAAPVAPVAVEPVHEAPVAVAPAPKKPAPVVAIKKPAGKSAKATLAAKPVKAEKPKAPAAPVAVAHAPVEAPKPVHVEAPTPVQVAVQPEVSSEVFGPEPEVRPVFPIMPAPELPVESPATITAAPVAPVEAAPVAQPEVHPVVPAEPIKPVHLPDEPPIVAAVPVAEAPVAHEAPIEAPAPVHYQVASAEASPTPSNQDLYGPAMVAQAPDVAVPNHEEPMHKPAAPREPVATHVAKPKAVAVPKKAVLKPKSDHTAFYKVRPGDSLSIIARDLLGDMMRWPELFAANRDQLTNPGWLPIGLSLKVPKAGEAVAMTKKTYVVRHGDSLSLIAKKHLGDMKKWPEIFAANRQTISDPTLIFPGQRLVLPVPMANAMPPLSWANLQASYAPVGMGGHDAGDEPRLALGGDVKYSSPDAEWSSLVDEI